MKFYSHHRNDILKAFEENGFSKADFSFIKRKGRIITQFNKDKSTFSYFQREEISVDDISREWIDNSYFEVKISDTKSFRVETWEEVIIHMSTWLNAIT